MAMTRDELEKLCKAVGISYLQHPEHPALIVKMSGYSGILDFAIVLDLEGRFLQFRTLKHLSCPIGHHHLPAVHGVLTWLNCEFRFVKFAWDRNDGEIVGFGDVWLMDGKLSVEQFRRMLENFVPTVDASRLRLQVVMETAEDPGPVDLAVLPPAQETSPEALLRQLRDRARGKRSGDKVGPAVLAI